jgi:hypothetical protein
MEGFLDPNQGKILPNLYLKVEVDMGSALSPLFFCLALDPLIRVLNTIPGVIKGRCYMGDNATFFQSNKTVDTIQAVFTRYHPAGLRVKQHKCCSFSTLTWKGKGGASWYRAA